MTLNEKIIRYSYLVTVVFLVLTGFGQMPIFKRYHVADIPGLGWLAQFYVTHAMHYIFAALFIAICTYAYVDHILDGRKERTLTKTGYAKSFMIAGLILTGVLMVIKNFSGTPYTPLMISLLDISHLLLCITFVVYGIITLVTGTRWVRVRAFQLSNKL
ncbi:MAG: hypothetical protein HQK67_09595 [Desulfamplus sp.]|nr:hypothetical protein [Desulfamplus sp.]